MAEDSDMANPVPGVPSEDDDIDYATDEKLLNVEKEISGDGGLKKTILRVGQGWETPEKGDECRVHYTGTLLDGTKFDSSRDRGEPFTFQLGQGKVIKGWDQGVATMKKGELAKLVCRADYAYGAAGSPPTIPPDATLQFEVELISWKSVKDITGDGGVIKTIQTDGKGWQTPKDDDEVVITYSARIRPPPEDGSKPQTAAEADLPVVASSPEGGAVFCLRDSPCKGFTAALKTMKPQESVVLLLSPEYAAGIADIPDGHQLEVQLELTEHHQVSEPAPGVSKKTLSAPEASFQKPNDGSTVTIVVTTRSADGQAVYEAEREVEYTTDEELVPEGLELAVGSMKENEHAIVTVTDPTLTAVPEGAVAGTGVPAGTVPVIYDVTLKAFSKAKEQWEMNNQEKGPPVLLIHGYGASAYHWRYQIPALAKNYRVFALDLLGFGWSEKALVEYSSGGLWGQQIRDFIQQVVYGNTHGASMTNANDNGTGSSSSSRSEVPEGDKVVLVGNSLGGYACMNAAVNAPELIKGVALLNSAGPLQDSDDPELLEPLPVPWYAGMYSSVRDSMTNLVKRVVLYFAFQKAKQPERIKEVLRMVYSSNDTIDEDLVDSIVVPATDPAAAEVFYRINSSKVPSKSVNQLLKQMRGSKLPLLLLWGDLDPWITPKRADRIQQLYPEADRIRLQSGHCPHDDTPEEANAALLGWLGKICK